MKKFLLTLLTGILLIAGITACSEKDNMDADVVIFSQKGCPHCIHAMAFINGDLKKTFPDISVAEYDINENRHNYELFAHTARRFQLGDRIGTPLIVVGDSYLMGWTTENQNKLTQFINQEKYTCCKARTSFRSRRGIGFMLMQKNNMRLENDVVARLYLG